MTQNSSNLSGFLHVTCRMQPGQTGEIRAAYNGDTHDRDIWDEIAGCEFTVVEDRGGSHVLVQVKAQDETWVARGRLRLRAEAS